MRPKGRNPLKPLVFIAACCLDVARAELPVAPASACAPVPICVEALPPTAPARGKRRHKRSALIMRMGPAQHRVLDRYLAPDEPQIIVAKFAYAAIDKDLEDEVVELFTRPHCQGQWRRIGDALTADKGPPHPSVDGVPTRDGQVFFHIPEADRLPVGRHEIYARVAADGTGARGLIEVLPRGTPVMVVDLDGTLTPQVSSEVTAFLAGREADLRPGAAAALQSLARKGYRFFYLSTRPDWLTDRARQYLQAYALPQGVVQLAPSALGELKIDAVHLKTSRLQYLRDHGLEAVAGFGDKLTDAAAYARAQVGGPHFILGRHDDEALRAIAGLGGTPIASWSDVRAWVQTLPDARCPSPTPSPKDASAPGVQGFAAPSGTKSSDTPLMQ